MEETGLHPIERPAFDIVQLEAGKPLVFKATVAVQPTVELGDYNELRVEPETVEVGQEDVDRVLNRLREIPGAVDPGGRPGPGDGRPGHRRPDGDLPPGRGASGAPDGAQGQRGHPGRERLPGGLRPRLLGARPGESRTFSLAWGTPPSPATAGAEAGPEAGAEAEAADEPATAEAEGGAAAETGEGAETPPAGGPTTSFAVTVKDVKRKQLPELDDDFAKSLGDHDTLAALTGHRTSTPTRNRKTWSMH